MPTTMQATRVQPKRKRAEISYIESDSEFSDGEASNASSLEDVVPAKKLKAANNKAVSTKPLPKKQVFPFSKLPAELKNQIYDIALRDENGIFLISRTKAYRRTVQRSTPNARDASGMARRRRQRWGHNIGAQSNAKKEAPSPAALVPNLLRLNHEIYDEAQPIFYGSNFFAFEDTMAMYSFLTTIGPKSCAALTDLTLKGWGFKGAHRAMNHPAFSVLGNAANLQSLYIDCRVHWGGPKGVARQIHRDGHCYLEAVGAAKGTFDAALEVLDLEPDNWDVPGHWSRFSRIASGKKDQTAQESLEEFRAELRKLLRSH